MATTRTLFSHALYASGLLVALLASGCELDSEGTDRSGNERDPATLSPGDGTRVDERSDADGAASNGDQSPDSATPGNGSPPVTPGQPADPTRPGGGSKPDGAVVAPASDAGFAVDTGAAKADAAPPGTPSDAGGTSKRCGTRGGVSCSDAQFCNFAPDVDCGGTDRGGVCETKPQVCADVYDPVCGCDDRTYGNECEAHGAGVSVKHDGACTAEECKAAGGTVKASKGADIPKCGPDEDQWSVGGGIEPILCCKKRAGTKPGTGKMCDGFAGIACEPKQFCNHEPAAGGDGCENIADGAGYCEPLPTGCTKEYKPVCGCDGRTYSNACTAHMSGVSVKRAEMCTDVDCKALGGKPVDGIGPAPVCPANLINLGAIRYSGGQIAVEGTICCAPR